MVFQVFKNRHHTDGSPNRAGSTGFRFSAEHSWVSGFQRNMSRSRKSCVVCRCFHHGLSGFQQSASYTKRFANRAGSTGFRFSAEHSSWVSGFQRNMSRSTRKSLTFELTKQDHLYVLIDVRLKKEALQVKTLSSTYNCLPRSYVHHVAGCTSTIHLAFSQRQEHEQPAR